MTWLTQNGFMCVDTRTKAIFFKKLNRFINAQRKLSSTETQRTIKVEYKESMVIMVQMSKLRVQRN